MTVAELRFLETVPNCLRDIANELKRINKTLEWIESKVSVPSSNSDTDGSEQFDTSGEDTTCIQGLS